MKCWSDVICENLSYENVPAKLEVKNLSHPSLFKEVSFAVRPGKSSDFLAWWGPGVPM